MVFARNKYPLLLLELLRRSRPVPALLHGVRQRALKYSPYSAGGKGLILSSVENGLILLIDNGRSDVDPEPASLQHPLLVQRLVDLQPIYASAGVTGHSVWTLSAMNRKNLVTHLLYARELIQQLLRGLEHPVISNSASPNYTQS